MKDDYPVGIKVRVDPGTRLYAGGQVILYGHSGPPQEVHPSLRGELERLLNSEIMAVPVWRRESAPKGKKI
ncbi:hypothetical protein HOD38_03915 [archaeon]|jgi:hypothetical protein|nr:hypothetical protein [archaeon]MBT4397388.1 hypothetical protein [archaeon]MBT4440768.1 hypothetical protein [archaeon]